MDSSRRIWEANQTDFALLRMQQKRDTALKNYLRALWHCDQLYHRPYRKGQRSFRSRAVQVEQLRDTARSAYLAWCNLLHGVPQARN